MNEFEFIRRLRTRVASQNQSPQMVRGIGDDAAVLLPKSGRELVVSTDLLVEDIDFRRKTTTPEFLAHKALAVSLSDIAAMGAEPRWALLSVGMPEDVWNAEFLDQFYEGFFKLADRYQVKLIGGDTSRSPGKIVIDSIVLGDCAAGGAVLRNRAQPGDLVFVTGELGGRRRGTATAQTRRTVRSQTDRLRSESFRESASAATPSGAQSWLGLGDRGRETGLSDDRHK